MHPLRLQVMTHISEQACNRKEQGLEKTAATMAIFAGGQCFTWSSPMLPKLNSEDSDINPIGRPVTVTESSFIVSAFNLGLLMGTPISVVLSKLLTKKPCLLLSIGPILIAHALLLFANQVTYFFIARLLMGISTGTMWCFSPTFIAEIAEDRNRGILGALAGIMSTAGSLLTYIVGPYTSVKYFSVINLVPAVTFLVSFGLFVPEDPYDLLQRNKISEAEVSLKKLRNNSKVEKELDYIRNCVNSDNEKRFIDLFKERGLRKAMGICIILMFIQQLCGVTAVISYTQTIFDLSGTTIPSDLSAIATGIISLIANIVSSILVDRSGRKILLITSCCFTSISMFTLATYFYLLTSNVDVSSVFWLPIVSLMVFMFFFNFGLAVIPWVIVGEMFPSTVKPLAVTMSGFFNFGLSLTVNVFFPYLMALVGLSGTFYIFAFVTFLAVIFCYFKLPETKGKTFKEIEMMLSK
ncbi:facilitated trehalose transporter Tret1-like isoform X2 [Rhynchophorus ferrugineus]|uniref:facilitated trehalose transporter Tret1-like isoform X2 n=1 Tax=Rhynchophorus ferrugineus TaxID=354439 RepID=UPI003FCC3A68